MVDAAWYCFISICLNNVCFNAFAWHDRTNVCICTIRFTMFLNCNLLTNPRIRFCKTITATCICWYLFIKRYFRKYVWILITLYLRDIYFLCSIFLLNAVWIFNTECIFTRWVCNKSWNFACCNFIRNVFCRNTHIFFVNLNTFLHLNVLNRLWNKSIERWNLCLRCWIKFLAKAFLIIIPDALCFKSIFLR